MEQIWLNWLKYNDLMLSFVLKSVGDLGAVISPEDFVYVCVCVCPSMLAVTVCKHVFAKGKAMMKVHQPSQGRFVFLIIIFFFQSRTVVSANSLNKEAFYDAFRDLFVQFSQSCSVWRLKTHTLRWKSKHTHL